MKSVLVNLSKLESAFVLHRCSRYDIQGKELLKTQEKFYLSDPAFRWAILGYTPDSVAAMLENLVYSCKWIAGKPPSRRYRESSVWISPGVVYYLRKSMYSAKDSGKIRNVI